MILWCDGAHDARENMRRDRALLEAFARAPAPDPDAAGDRGGAGPEPVLRLFQFAPPGITLGHAQDPARVLDLERCRADGIAWAMRPTGGRAIFHAQEWTYSLAAARDDPEWGGGLWQSYERTSRLILASLVHLGVPAVAAARLRDAGGPRSSSRATAAACFASAARHEILLDGRKLVGSAQRRSARALLQQGSVLLGPGHSRLADYLAFSAERRGEAREELRASAADAGPFLGGDASLRRWADALMGALPAHTRRLEAAAGEILLTLPETGPYTRSVL